MFWPAKVSFIGLVSVLCYSIAQSDNNQVFPTLLLAQVNAFEIKRHVTLK